MPSRKSRSLASGTYTRRHVLKASGLLIPAAAIIPGLMTRNAFAATTIDFYISPTGSDSNPGTQSAPWAITALNTKQALYAGRTIGLLDGTYNVSSLFGSLSHDGYTPALQIKGGSALSSTTILAVNRGKAIIQANNGTTYPPNNPVMGSYGAAVKGYITIDGIVLRGSSSKGLYLGDYGVATGGTRFPGIIVRNCEFTGSNGTALSYGNNLSLIELAGTSNALIANNYFHDNVGYSANNADHFTATLQWYGENSIYEHNTVVNSGGIYGKETGNFGTTIRYNFIDTTNWATCAIMDFVGTATVAKGAATSIHHNVLIGAKAADMRPTLGGGYLGDRLEFYNNTLVVQASGQSSGLMICVAATNASVYNNIVHSLASGDLALCALNPTAPGIVDYNLYYSTSGTYTWNTLDLATPMVRVGVSGGFSGWKLALGGAESHSMTASNPTFTNSGTDATKYTLASGSAAKGTGRVGGTSAGAATDMGAFGNGAPSLIGCDFNVSSTSVKPATPTLSVA